MGVTRLSITKVLLSSIFYYILVKSNSNVSSASRRFTKKFNLMCIWDYILVKSHSVVNSVVNLWLKRLILICTWEYILMEKKHVVNIDSEKSCWWANECILVKSPTVVKSVENLSLPQGVLILTWGRECKFCRLNYRRRQIFLGWIAGAEGAGKFF